jgi:hypothetical protein
MGSEHITCVVGGKNGLAKMTSLGPTFWKTAGKPDPASKPNQTDQIEPDQLHWSGTEEMTEWAF